MVIGLERKNISGYVEIYADGVINLFQLIEGVNMIEKPAVNIVDGAQCKVIGGVHMGKFGTIRDIKTGKTGHISITVVQTDGERFKTLARNVVVIKP